MKIKEFIYENARKDKKFIRILKETGLYKRYFFMLNKHGNEYNVNGLSSYKNMWGYVFHGFSWIDDPKTPNVWAPLHDMVHLLNENKPIPLNKLKNTDYWKAILVQLNQ